VTAVLPGARIGRVLMIIVAVVVILGLVVSAIGVPAVY
jgi:hypothetical protein